MVQISDDTVKVNGVKLNYKAWSQNLQLLRYPRVMANLLY